MQGKLQVTCSSKKKKFAAISENSLTVPQKVQQKLAYDPAFLLLGVHPR
jgi:hypothetical protein